MTVDLLADDWPGWQPPCLERRIPGTEAVTYIHGYTGADAAQVRKLARSISKGEPDQALVDVCQVLIVCRTAPGSKEHTFPVKWQTAKDFVTALREKLPGPFVEFVCRESDALSMQDYFPQSKGDTNGEAGKRLGEALSDPEYWVALDLVSRKLCGRPLAENGEPIGNVLTLLERDQSARNAMLELFGTLAAAGGVG